MVRLKTEKIFSPLFFLADDGSNATTVNVVVLTVMPAMNIKQYCWSLHNFYGRQSWETSPFLFSLYRCILGLYGINKETSFYNF